MINKLFKNHGFLVIIGCLMPIIVLGILLIFGFNTGTFSFLLILLCPLAHIFLMRNHNKNSKDHH